MQVSLIKKDNLKTVNVGSVPINNFSRLKFKVIKDKTLAFSMLQRDQVHFLRKLPYFKPSAPEAKSSKVYSLDEGIVNKLFLFKWNFDKNIFKDINVRKALSLLIYKDTLNKKFYNNSRVVISRPFFQNTRWSDKYKKLSYEHDPKAAKALLEKSGWLDLDKNGTLEKDGDELAFSVFYVKKEDERVLSYL